jgi:hypothetical protein
MELLIRNTMQLLQVIRWNYVLEPAVLRVASTTGF